MSDFMVGHALPGPHGALGDLCVYEAEVDLAPSRKEEEPPESCRSSRFKFALPMGWDLGTVSVRFKRDQPASCWSAHVKAHSLRDVGILATESADRPSNEIDGLDCGYRPPKRSDGFWFGIDDGVDAIFSALESAMGDKSVGMIAICGETSAAKSKHLLGLIYRRLRRSPVFETVASEIESAVVREEAWTKDNFKALGDARERNDDQALQRLESERVRQRIVSVPSLDLPYAYSHLLTIEEPIEDFLFSARDRQTKRIAPLDPRLNAALGVHYTPRDMLLDFTGEDERSVLYSSKLTPLARALQLDALRQKPTIVLVGESRNEEDLVEVVRFAATGHLICTTFHAGSLQEGLGKILRAWKARSSSERGEIASRVFAVIHLRAGKITDDAGKAQTFVLPSIWVGTDRALDGLVKDGLRSVVPQRLPASAESAVLGRTFFAEQLGDRRKPGYDAKKNVRLPAMTDKQHLEMMRIAVGWDLEER